MMGLPGRERGLTIYSAVWIQLHKCEGWKHYSWNYNIKKINSYSFFWYMLLVWGVVWCMAV